MKLLLRLEIGWASGQWQVLKHVVVYGLLIYMVEMEQQYQYQKITND